MTGTMIAKSFPCTIKGRHAARDLSAWEQEHFQKEDVTSVATQLYFIESQREHFRQEPKQEPGTKTVKQEFEALFNNWFEETAHLSIVRQQITHISFLKIIGMGKTALPFVFREFEKIPMLAWLVALEAIVGKDIASNDKTHRDAVKTWLDWGEKNGFR